jgi:hypothetical protein
LSAYALRRDDSRSTLVFIGVLSALVGALALCANRFHNGDLYLQLASGRFISRHGFVANDPFPTIAQGHPWFNQQWLSELFFYKLAGSVGMTGLTVAYAIVLSLPLFWLLWYCRHKEVLVLAAGTALYFPALLSIIHPRAAGFSLLAFSVLVTILLHATGGERSRRWALLAVPAVFVLWANLHGGLLAGLLLIALVAIGLAIDRRRGIAAVVGVGAVAFAATFATPLGAGLWSYIGSFGNPALKLATTEWGPVFQSPLAMLYVAAAAAFAAWIWTRRPPSAPITPLLVTAGFLLATVYSLRNMIFIAPALFFQIAHAKDRTTSVPLRPVLAAGTAAVLALVVWGTVLGPAKSGAYLKESPVDYALRHPPKEGRIAALGGVSSYLLWRSPHTPVLVNGWLEHFSPAALRANYGVVRGRAWAPDPARWDIGGVITRNRTAVRALERRGFVVKHKAPEGFYLVRAAR